VLTANASARLGGELATLDKTRASRYGISGGVIVNRVNDGGILKTARVLPGFIITSVIVDGEEQGVDSVEDLNTLLQNVSGTIRIRGVYPDYGEAYTYSLKLDQ
jgi:serine protease Do